jgi:hypothetical protein
VRPKHPGRENLWMTTKVVRQCVLDLSAERQSRAPHEQTAAEPQAWN